MSDGSCAIDNCNVPNFEYGDKCIFHCEKDDWYEEDKNGNRDWSKSDNNIEKFWTDITNEKIHLDHYNFEKFIFPRFLDSPVIRFHWTNDPNKVLQKPVRFFEAIFKDDAIFHIIFKEYANFSGVNFERKADFEACDFQGGSIFKQCRFGGGANYEKAIFRKKAEFLEKTSFEKETSFKSAKFHQETDFKDIYIDGNIGFEGATFKGVANFQVELKKGSCTFEGAHFQQNINFANSTFNGDVNFTKADSNISGHLTFDTVTFKKDFLLNECPDIQGVVAFNATHFEQISNFSKTTFKRDFQVNNSVFGQSTLFVGTTFNRSVFISDTAFGKGAVFNKPNFARFVQIESPQKDSNIKFENLSLNVPLQINSGELNSLIFNYFSVSENQELDISDISIDTLGLDNFDRSSSFKLHNVEVKTELNVNNSDLANTRINNLIVDRAKINLFNSSFADVLFNNVKWGNIQRVKGNRDVFRQLKKYNDDQGNYIDASGFHAMEMKMHHIEDLKGWSGINPFDWQILQDKLTFLVNRVVSNFSRSWFRPLLWFVFIGVVFHAWFSYQIGKFYIVTDLYYQCYLDYFNDLLRFVNPFEREADEDFQDGYYIWFLHKVFSGFVIYHFIVALRRQTKR